MSYKIKRKMEEEEMDFSLKLDDLVMVVLTTKTFIGRWSPKGLNNCVEVILIHNSNGQMGINCILIGTLCRIEEDHIVIIVDNNSVYYHSYVQAVSGIEILKNKVTLQ